MNMLKLRHNDHHFSDDKFKCIFLNGNFWILDKKSLEYVLLGLINDIIALIQVMAWRRTGEKPFCESMVVCFADAYMRRSASVSWIRIFID